MNSVRAEINILNEYLNQEKKFNVKSVKVIENSGDFDFIIKFPQFNDYDSTVTIQVPSKFNFKYFLNFT
jgi:hypothetical protein